MFFVVGCTLRACVFRIGCKHAHKFPLPGPILDLYFSGGSFVASICDKLYVSVCTQSAVNVHMLLENRQ